MMRAVLGQSLFYGTAAILSRAASVVLLWFLPPMLTPSDYGALGMILTLSAVLVTVVPLEITQGLIRYYPTASVEDRPLYAGTAFYFTVFSFAVLVIGALAASGPLTVFLLGDVGYRSVLQLGVLLIALNGIFYFVQAQFRWEFRSRDFAIISLLYSVLTVALSIGLGIVMSVPLWGVVVGQALAALAVVALALVTLRSSFAPRLDIPKLRAMLHLALPIVPASLAMFISNNASRFILNGTTSLADVGHFTFAGQIAGIGLLAVVGMQAALTPLIMAHHEEPQSPATIGRLFEITTALGLAVALLLGLFAPAAIAAFGPPDYRPAAPLVILLAPAMLISQMYIFSPGFLIAKKTSQQLWVSAASAVICIAANFLLIPVMGILGAAAATLAASVFFLASWFGVSQSLYPIPIRWVRVILLTTASLAAGIAAAWGDYPSLTVEVAAKLAVIVFSFVGAVASGLLPLRQGLEYVQSLAARFRSGHAGEP